VRAQWIEERSDTEELPGPTSRYGLERLADPKLAEMRFSLKRRPRRGKSGRNVTQMHYAKRGIVTPEMEYIALRETSGATRSRNRSPGAPRRVVRGVTAEIHYPEFVRDEVARAAPSFRRTSIIPKPNDDHRP